MKTKVFLSISACFLLLCGQSAFAQHEGHDEGEGMACCSKDSMEMGGDHDKGGHDMGMSMTHVMITHEVEDVDKWLAAWSGENSRENLFKANGAKHVHVLQDPGNPNVTGLIIAVADMEKFQAMLESAEGQAAAAEDTVIWDTMTMLVEKK